MRCFVSRTVTDAELVSDIKELIPDAGLRRRMSRVLKMSVATAVEAAGGTEGIASADAVITATGLGCLADSERFLRNMIADGEQMLNPTPFIQSTFNTAGGQIALLGGNHCYNVTYVNRSHGFEDALLDAMMRIADGESRRVLLGAFDERTPSQHRIMERMGLYRHAECGEGAVFMVLTDAPAADSEAAVVRIDFPERSLSESECRAKYASVEDAAVIVNRGDRFGLFPTASAQAFAAGVRLIREGAREAVIYNEYLGGKPAVAVLGCIG
ncbi:MAG: beta-ketoacyl synthase chain length factor [Alistipes sp.]|nr:beta-ketoacyl synthase chain length factor [Alistipes sp.]